MSNSRKPAAWNGYRGGYLRSPAWFARRDAGFRRRRGPGHPIVCAICLQPGTDRTLQLHHADYEDVTQDGGQWNAREPDADLIPLHRECHERLHRLIDHDVLLARLRTRRDATEIAIAGLRREHQTRKAG